MRALPDGCADVSSVERLWAREFRYDGPRQRYLARELDPDTLEPIVTADVWTDYLGDVAVLGFLFDQQDNEVRLTGYLPGISQTDVALADTYY